MENNDSDSGVNRGDGAREDNLGSGANNVGGALDFDFGSPVTDMANLEESDQFLKAMKDDFPSFRKTVEFSSGFLAGQGGGGSGGGGGGDAVVEPVQETDHTRIKRAMSKYFSSNNSAVLWQLWQVKCLHKIRTDLLKVTHEDISDSAVNNEDIYDLAMPYLLQSQKVVYIKALDVTNFDAEDPMVVKLKAGHLIRSKDVISASFNSKMFEFGPSIFRQQTVHGEVNRELSSWGLCVFDKASNRFVGVLELLFLNESSAAASEVSRLLQSEGFVIVQIDDNDYSKSDLSHKGKSEAVHNTEIPVTGKGKRKASSLSNDAEGSGDAKGKLGGSDRKISLTLKDINLYRYAGYSLENAATLLSINKRTLAVRRSEVNIKAWRLSEEEKPIASTREAEGTIRIPYQVMDEKAANVEATNAATEDWLELLMTPEDTFVDFQRRYLSSRPTLRYLVNGEWVVLDSNNFQNFKTLAVEKKTRLWRMPLVSKRKA